MEWGCGCRTGDDSSSWKEKAVIVTALVTGRRTELRLYKATRRYRGREQSSSIQYHSSTKEEEEEKEELDGKNDGGDLCII